MSISSCNRPLRQCNRTLRHYNHALRHCNHALQPCNPALRLCNVGFTVLYLGLSALIRHYNDLSLHIFAITLIKCNSRSKCAALLLNTGFSINLELSAGLDCALSLIKHEKTEFLPGSCAHADKGLINS